MKAMSTSPSRKCTYTPLHLSGSNGPHSQAIHRIPRKPVPIGSQETLLSPSQSYSEESEEKKFAHQPASSGISRTLATWWLEASCSLLVIAILAVIVSVTYAYQDMPLSQWRHDVSINTMIAVLIAILKAAMLLVIAEGISQLKWIWYRQVRPLDHIAAYDMASRGPWGSIKLLWTIRGRDMIATIGAIVTVLAIATDAFAQQLVHLYPCTTTAFSSQAYIPRTNQYLEPGTHLFADSETVPNGLQAAIYAGVYNYDMVKVPYNCPTGSCDYDRNFHTIGYCSECIDITSQVIPVTINITDQSSCAIDTTCYQLGRFGINYTLPSDSLSFAYDDVAIETTFSTAVSFNNKWIVKVGQDVNGSLGDALTSICGGRNNASVFGCDGYGGVSCTIQPCIRTYNSSISNGALLETWSSTYAYTNQGDPLYGGSSAVLNVPCLNATDHRTVADAGYIIPTTGPNATWFPYFGDGYGDPLVNVSSDCRYELYMETTKAASEFLGGFFDGNVTYSGPSYDYPTGPSTLEVMNMTFFGIDNTMKHVAESMTTYIRQHGDSSAINSVGGTMSSLETCVHLRWAWLGFPAALGALTIVFFLVVLVRTWHETSHGLDWKSSPLALLYHGLEHNEEGSRRTAMTRSEMMKEAMQQDVRMTNNHEHGWRNVKFIMYPKAAKH